MSLAARPSERAEDQRTGRSEGDLERDYRCRGLVGLDYERAVHAGKPAKGACVGRSAGEITAQLLTIARLSEIAIYHAPEIIEGLKLVHNDVVTENVRGRSGHARPIKWP
jgi:hypothetical protein